MTMETEYPLTKSDRNRISRGRTKHLQLVLSDLMMLTLTYALNYLELLAEQHPERLAKEFKNVFEPFQWTKMVIDILTEGRRTIIEGMGVRYYALEMKDLFQCLSPATQEKLKMQGIWYEPAPPSPPDISDSKKEVENGHMW
jgi:hypothetical protein